MFHELRADVFPVDDIGVQKAIASPLQRRRALDGRGDARDCGAVAPVAQRRDVVPVALARSDPVEYDANADRCSAERDRAFAAGARATRVIASRRRRQRRQRRHLGCRADGRGTGASIELSAVRVGRPYNAPVTESTPHPYARLTPDVVLDALDELGIRGDGRLLAARQLREPRLPGLDREDAPPVVAKFYRPGRWTDAQILEEHAFVAELAAREIPVVAPLARRRRDAPRERRLPVRRVSEVRRPRARARGPRDARMARPLPRAHPRGRRAQSPFAAPAGARRRDVRRRAARLPARARLHPGRPACRRGAASPRSRSTACAARSSAPATCADCGCTATATPATCCGPTAARTSSTSTTRAWVPRCRTCGCCCRATAPR